jgi:hypothetical protein
MVEWGEGGRRLLTLTVHQARLSLTALRHLVTTARHSEHNDRRMTQAEPKKFEWTNLVEILAILAQKRA